MNTKVASLSSLITEKVKARISASHLASSIARVAVMSVVFLAMGTGGTNTARADDPSIPFERYKLKNGLEVILHQDNRVPLVAVSIWYHVGSGDEKPGKSGYAHLFEHMLFQGSEHVGEDRHFSILRNIGASQVNGTTNNDRTNYFEVVPSNQLETVLWMESDRLGFFLPMLTKKSLDNQIEVVRNERRQRYDNVPYGKTRFAINEVLYPEGHPFRYLVIGLHQDLEAASLDDIKTFYKEWYVPSNATLAIGGDFETEEAKALIQKWFGGLPTASPPSAKAKAARKAQLDKLIEESKKGASKRIEIKDEFASLRRLDYLWHSPSFFTPGDAELDIVAGALGREGTGRLYKRLVLGAKLAKSVSVSQISKELSSVFQISVMVKPGAKIAKIEKILEQEIEKIRSKPVTKEEFERVVVGQEASFIWSLEPVLARVETLQSYNHFVGNPDYITEDLDRLRKANLENITKVAAEVLAPAARFTVLTSPGKSPGKPPEKPKRASKKGDK